MWFYIFFEESELIIGKSSETIYDKTIWILSISAFHIEVLIYLQLFGVVKLGFTFNNATLDKYVASLTPSWEAIEYEIELVTEGIMLIQSELEVPNETKITATIEDTLTYDEQEILDRIYNATTMEDLFP